MFYAIQELLNTLKNARKAKKLSQRALADKVGIPQSHISKIETGHVNIKLASFIEIARTLELDVLVVPRQDIAMVKSLITSQEAARRGEGIKPAYTLDDEDDDA